MEYFFEIFGKQENEAENTIAFVEQLREMLVRVINVITDLFDYIANLF